MWSVTSGPLILFSWGCLWTPNHCLAGSTKPPAPAEPFNRRLRWNFANFLEKKKSNCPKHTEIFHVAALVSYTFLPAAKDDLPLPLSREPHHLFIGSYSSFHSKTLHLSLIALTFPFLMIFIPLTYQNAVSPFYIKKINKSLLDPQFFIYYLFCFLYSKIPSKQLLLLTLPFPLPILSLIHKDFVRFSSL